MPDARSSNSIDRFVANARRLVIIQIIFALIALIVAAVASALIYKAILEQNKAAVLTKEANDAREAALLARVDADEAISLSQRLSGQNSILRQALIGVGTGDYDAVIESLQNNLNVETYPVIATAHYLAAQAGGDDQMSRYVEASAALVEAIRLNQAEVESADSDARPETSLYLEFAGIQCAAAASAPADSQAALEQSLTVISVPEAVAEDVRDNGLFARHPLVRAECGGALMATAARSFGIEERDARPSTTDKPPPPPSRGPAQIDERYRISRVFMHIPSEDVRPLAKAISENVGRASGLNFPGTERVITNPAAYKASVRFYYADQIDQARSIRDQIVAAAREAGASWDADALPLIKLNMSDLPTERIEVWLPAGAPVEGGVDYGDTDALTALNIVYVQRSADGQSVTSVLNRLGLRDKVRISNPQISGDRNDALACHPDLQGAGLDEFKTLATALIDNGVPIRRITVYRDPASKPANQVEILHSSAATGAVLTRQEIADLTGCRVVG